MFRYVLVTLVFLLAYAPAQACDQMHQFINSEFNLGFAAECNNVVIGAYRNSEKNINFLGGYKISFYNSKRWDVGIVASGVADYKNESVNPTGIAYTSLYPFSDNHLGLTIGVATDKIQGIDKESSTIFGGFSFRF